MTVFALMFGATVVAAPAAYAEYDSNGNYYTYEYVPYCAKYYEYRPGYEQRAWYRVYRNFWGQKVYKWSHYEYTWIRCYNV